MSCSVLNQTLCLFLLTIGFFKYSFHFISSRPKAFLESTLDNYDKRAVQSFHLSTEWSLQWLVKYAIIGSVQIIHWNHTLSCQKKVNKITTMDKNESQHVHKSCKEFTFLQASFWLPFWLFASRLDLWRHLCWWLVCQD